MAIRPRAAMNAALGIAVAVFVVSACTTDYQLGKDNPNFGDPSALKGKTPPGPTLDINADGGAPGTSGGPKCGTPVDGGPCAVSFAKDVLGAFVSVGGCAEQSCHGGPSPTFPPRIAPGDAPGVYAEFAKLSISTGKVYINPCKTDPAESAILCNLLPPGAQGLCGVHMPSGTGVLPPEVIGKIETWVKCGAPNN